MGFRIEIEGMRLEALDYSVSESSSPLAAGDSSGAVGTFQITVPVPDDSLALIANPSAEVGFGYGEGPYGSGPYGGIQDARMSVNNSPWLILRELGPQILINKAVYIFDSRKGFTLGTITSTDISRDGGTVTLSGTSRLGSLNVYGIQAQPFVGTLRAAFEYYLSLAEVSGDVFVDDAIGDRPVVFPGWTGELWYYLKLMAASQDCDISLVSGVILLRAIRNRVATSDRDLSRQIQAGGSTLAQAIEVYQYSNREITNELVYPPGGWTPEVEVLNVNAGETSEYTLDLEASVSSIQQPVMQTFVPDEYSASSVYTIVADDGLPVDPSLWASRGGSLEIRIDPDTSHLLVTLIGPRGLPTSAGVEATNFSVALGSDTTGNRYSTLRIVGSGVAFNKVKKRIRTGVPASKTATEIGVTIDNPFISTVNDLYRAGTRAAREYAGVKMSLSGVVTAVNRRGDTGQATYPTYGQVQARLKETLGASVTYGQVQTWYISQSLTTYSRVRDYWFEVFRDNDQDQVFGNVQGARIFDRKSRRWYRIRQGTLNPAQISVTGDDDLTQGDVDEFYTGLTYDSVGTTLAPFTYAEVELLGMYK